MARPGQHPARIERMRRRAAAGLSPAEVAAEHDMSERHVRRLLKDETKRGKED